jgi:hypothetical protein
MGYLFAQDAAPGQGAHAFHRPWGAILPVLATLALLAAGCQGMKPLDTAPLDASGMSYDAVEQLKGLHVTPAEIGEIAKARQAGFSDADCVRLIQIYRQSSKPFDAGEAVSGLLQAGVAEGTIIQLAQMQQLGLDWGELQAMHLAGLSDAIVLEVARRHAAGQPVLGGASLALLKNAGLRQTTLLNLARSGVPDSQASAILAYRRRGASETEILRRFAKS